MKNKKMIAASFFCFLYLSLQICSSDKTLNPEERNEKLVKVECYSIDWDIRFAIAMTPEKIRTYSEVKYYCYSDSELLAKLEKAVDQFIRQGKCFGPDQLDVRFLCDLWFSSGKKVTIAFRRPYTLTIDGDYCFDEDGILVSFGDLLPGKHGQRFIEDQGKFTFDERQHVIKRKD